MKINLANPDVVLLCLVAIGLAWTLPSVAEYDVADAVGLWLLDEGEGEVAKDSSPTGDDGELWRDPEWVDGRFGKALHFDGQSFIWIKEAVGVPEGTTPRTIMLFFKWDAVNLDSSEILISLGVNNWRQMVVLVLASGLGPGVHTHDDVEYFEWDGDTEWHHLAAVFPEGATRSDEFLLYFDGARQDSLIDDDVNGINTVGGKITIACSASISQFFTGTMDDIAVFPLALTDDDIARAARSGVTRGQFLAVSPSGKLTTAWGDLKLR